MRAKHFYDFFEAIPDHNWTTRKADNGQGQYCAMGHCIRKLDHLKYMELVAIADKFGAGPIPSLNDGNCPHYRQDSPKKRILAFLKDAAKFGL